MHADRIKVPVFPRLPVFEAPGTVRGQTISIPCMSTSMSPPQRSYTTDDKIPLAMKHGTVYHLARHTCSNQQNHNATRNPPTEGLLARISEQGVHCSFSSSALSLNGRRRYLPSLISARVTSKMKERSLLFLFAILSPSSNFHALIISHRVKHTYPLSLLWAQRLAKTVDITLILVFSRQLPHLHPSRRHIPSLFPDNHLPIHLRSRLRFQSVINRPQQAPPSHHPQRRT